MRFGTVPEREPVELRPHAAPRQAQAAAPRAGYDLATALRIVRRMETSATRGAVFAEITHKNPLYRLVDRAYSRAGPRLLQPLFLLLYMLKCTASLGPVDGDETEAVSIANFENERHTIERLTALVPESRILQLSLDRKHLFNFAQLQATLRMIGAARRAWPFLSRLARTHSFMPAARIASALAFYVRAVQLFTDRPKLGAAVIASNYSPEAVGLAAAAHRLGRRVIYINHAPVPANGALVPPVLADCAVFYGDAIRQTYETRSLCTAEVALVGQPGVAQPMAWNTDVRTVGIFLTALTRPAAVAALVEAIRADRPDVQILIRNHPVALLQTDFAWLEARFANLQVTIGNPLDDEISACDMIFCGNSGVALNVLRGGRPVAYLAALDGLNFDYNGFVETHLVCSVSGWTKDVYQLLKAFYTGPAWRRVMRSYDASYEADRAELEIAAAEIIRRHLNPKPGQAPAESRAQSSA